MKSLYIIALISCFSFSKGLAQTVIQDVDYTYNSDGFVTEEKTVSSTGETLMVRHVYPKDFFATAPTCIFSVNSDPVALAYSNLVTRNMINVPIETYTVLKKPGQTEVVISGSVMVYSETTPYPKEKYVLETTVPISINSFSPLHLNSYCAAERSSSYQLSETYNEYDMYGNPIQKTVLGARYSNPSSSSYLYGYKGAYCTAIASNAAPNEIAYTNFELASDKGGWTYNTNNRAAITPGPTAVSIVGDYAYNLHVASVATGGLPQKKYIVSFWASTGSVVSVSGSTSTLTGETVNGWTYYEHLITASNLGVTGISLTATSSTAQIDELRLYPYDAQMFTYRYKPLVGVSAQCDQKNKFTFYTYDQMNRVDHIYDQKGHIVKKFEYRLQQPE